MKKTLRTSVSALLLLLPLAFSAPAHATNWDDDSYDWLDSLASYIKDDLSSLLKALGNASSNGNNGNGNNGNGNTGNSGNGNSGKVQICHRTSSSKNPWVIVEVSTNAKQSHYDHGDPLNFTLKSDGSCAPVVIPAPNVTLNLAASEIAIGATTTATWTSTNATSCKLGSTTVPVNGSAPVGPYSSTGNKTITISCTGAGGSDSDSETLKVKTAPPAPPTVTLTLQPSQIAIGAKAKLSWDSENASSCKLSGTGNLYSSPFTISVDDDGYYWKGPFYKNGTATYTVTCTGPGGTTSESVVLTVGSSTPPAAPTITLTLEPSQIAIGAKAKLSWDSENATSCKLSGNGNLYSSPFTISVDDDGYYWKGPFSKAGTATYTVTCTGPGGTTSESVTLTVGSSTPAPSVTLSLASNAIFVGATTTATWDSTNATSCTLNGQATSGVDGSANVGPYSSAGPQTITVVCKNSANVTATASQTLTVNPLPVPAVTLSLASNSIYVGAKTTATWDSTNATSCTLNGNATSAVDGSADVGPFAAAGPQTVTVVCVNAQNPSVNATATQTLTVNALPVPTVTLSLAKSSVRIGGTTTATWDSTDATSCTLNGVATSGVDGSGPVGPFADAGPQTITVSCVNSLNPAVTATDSKTLTVTPPTPPTVTLTLAQNTVVVNTTTTASWTSTNANTCTLNGQPTSAVNGSASVGPFGTPGAQTVEIVCVGDDGTASDSKIVTVTAALPTVSLTLTPAAINVNGSSTATWTSTNATSCTLNGAPVGSTNGSMAIGPYLVAGNVNVTVNCTGAGGSASDTEVLVVTDATTPSSTSVLFCATGRFGGTRSNVWVVRYDYETMTFEGNSATAPVMTGTVVADPGAPVEQAFFAPNTSFTYQIGVPAAGGILATGGQSGPNLGIDDLGNGDYASYFRVTVFTLDILGVKIAITGNHLAQFDTTCPELQNVPPPPER